MLKVSVFDLEGPLSPADHAALACKYVGEEIGFKDFERFFEMLSSYDDYLVDNPWQRLIDALYAGILPALVDMTVKSSYTQE